jgi:hypothetical protein
VSDFRDYFILGHVNAAGIAATVYTFMHPDPVTFGVYGTLIAALIGSYKWFVYKDSKVPDACP